MLVLQVYCASVDRVPADIR